MIEFAVLIFIIMTGVIGIVLWEIARQLRRIADCAEGEKPPHA